LTRYIKDNALTLVLLMLFTFSIVGHWLAGWKFENEELARSGAAGIGAVAYLVDPAFISSVFENWESEFLQMGAYVVLTAMFVQRGSAESKDPDAPPRPGDGRAGLTWLYAHSLGIALALLFACSFLLHWLNSAAAAAEEARQHGETPLTAVQYLGSAQLWFESFQSKPVAAANSDTGT
jgi:hypothetical protein